MLLSRRAPFSSSFDSFPSLVFDEAKSFFRFRSSFCSLFRKGFFLRPWKLTRAHFSCSTFMLSSSHSSHESNFPKEGSLANSSQHQAEHFSHSDPSYKIVDRPQFPVEKFSHYKRDDTDAYTQKAFSYFVVGSAGLGAVGLGKNAVVGLLQTWGASADVLALANIEVDLSVIPQGATVTLKWRGKPIFIKHRTEEEIEIAKNTPLSDLVDPQKDEERAKRPEWLVVLGVCTHLGCVPLANQGDYNGWFCPCHGSHYDLSGRIRKGPAPLNLEVPPYTFLADDKMIVGIDQENPSQ